MRVAITGHTSGIGKALCEYFRARDCQIIGLSRQTGHDLFDPSQFARAVEAIVGCDLLVNNAPCGFQQTLLLLTVYEKWREQRKWILNIGSDVDHSGEVPPRTVSYKAALDHACEDLHRRSGSKCRVYNLRLGWTRTPRLAGIEFSGPAMDTGKIVRAVDWLLQLPPDVHVPELTLVPWGEK